MFGWWGKRPDKAKLQRHKTVVIKGSRFVIREVAPLSDFLPENIPQVFTYTGVPRRRDYILDKSNLAAHKKLQNDMMAAVHAGVVYPELLPAGKEKEGITVADLFRDQEMGYLLYLAIIEHSCIKFKGLKKCFFLTVKWLLSFTTWLRRMGRGRAITPLRASS